MAVINVPGTWNAHLTKVVGNKEARRVVNVRGELPAKGDGIASEEPPAPLKSEIRSTGRSQKDVIIAGLAIPNSLIRILAYIQGKLMEVVKIERLVNHP